MLAMTNLLIEIRLLGAKSILFIVLGLLVSCAANRHPKSNMGVVLGKVTYEKGNQMPGQDSSASATGVIRDIYIYELTNELDVSKKNLLYTDINSKVITKVSSESVVAEVGLRLSKLTWFVIFSLSHHPGNGDIQVIPVVLT